MNNTLKMIPVSIMQKIANSQNKRRLADARETIWIQKDTKNALLVIKQMNGISSVSNVIDLLLSMVSLEQYSDPKNTEALLRESRIEIAKGGTPRTVILDGKEFYSINSAAKFYKCAPMTIRNRINDLVSTKWKDWNFANEDIELKYSKHRVIE